MMGRRARLIDFPVSSAADGAAKTALQRHARRLRIEEARAKAEDKRRGGEPTPEQQARNVYEFVKIKEPGAARTRLARRNMTGSQLDRWYHRNLICARQFAAADLYRGDYARSGIVQNLTGRYGPGAGAVATSPSYAGTMPGTIAQIAARERWRQARAALPGSLVHAFDRLVIDEHDAEIVGARNGRGGRHAARFAMEWVRICCDELAAFYGVMEER